MMVLIVAYPCRYGRNYYTRYDYEGVDTAKADKVMSLLEGKMVRALAVVYSAWQLI